MAVVLPSIADINVVLTGRRLIPEGLIEYGQRQKRIRSYGEPSIYRQAG